MAERDQQEVGHIHYLPHHPMTREDKKTTKVRVVSDVSARSVGPSLNDCLHSGPPLTQEVFDVFLRFRVHCVALTRDDERHF